MARYSENVNKQPLRRWLTGPLLEAVPWRHRLRHYAVFLLLIALSSPFSHAYLGIQLSPVEAIVHTTLVVAAVALGIGLIEGALASVLALRPDRVRRQTISTGGFLARAIAAYALSIFAVGLLHQPWPYTRAIMSAHASAAQAAMAWELTPVALLVVYVMYQIARKDHLARQVAALTRINEELEAVQQERQATPPPCGARQPTEHAIRVQSNGVELPLAAESVVRIQADENYCHLVPEAGAEGSRKRHMVRMTLKEALDAVPHQLFIQPHRSHLVNLRHVAELCRDGRRRELRLSNGDRVPVSRSRLGAVEARIRVFLTQR